MNSIDQQLIDIAKTAEITEDILAEKKKKKPYDSMYVGTGNPAANVDFFNKHAGSYMNGTVKAQASQTSDTLAAMSPDGGNSVSLGGGDSAGGDAGGCCEALTEDMDLVAKFNIALAYAKEAKKPVIYGYARNGTNYSVDPIICNELNNDTKEFMKKYHPSGSVFVAYPNKSFVESLTLTESSWEIDSVKLADGGRLSVRWEKGEGFQVTKTFAPDSNGISHEDFVRTYATERDAVRAYLRYKKQLELAPESLQETKRYVRRYYIRPYDQFCSNKDQILKALLDHEDEDAVIYTLNNLGDVKDIGKLTSNDIIYYYKDGILYDKNEVRIMDYDLAIKHEEERPAINPETVSTARFKDVYDDRMTDVTELEESHELDLVFEDAKTSHVDDKCCICGEEIIGYGNNAEPYAHGRCCDACNVKFVIPARIAALKGEK